MDGIYLDNNASTPVLPAVWDAMRPYFTDVAGNPASSHRAGRRARRALEDAREQTAALLGAGPDEVVFTSGATEANNLALFGLTVGPPGRLLLAPIEHPCVVEPARQLAAAGFTLDLLPVDAAGILDTGAFRARLGPDVRLAALMLANHETGAVQPVRACAARARDHGVALHCDAAAAVGKIPVDFHELDVATLTVSAHKLHGPKGVGALLVRKGTRLRAQLFGGQQQQGRRPGTESVALAVGLAAALDLAVREMDERREKVHRLRRLFLDRVNAAAPVVLNGPAAGGVPHTLNLSFPGCRADVLLMRFDLAGVACSTGSACSSGSLLPSPVLDAMSIAADVLHSAMRFSLSHLLTEADVVEAADRVVRVVRAVRQAEVA